METLEKRIEEAQKRIVPILNELNLDIAGAAYLDEEGRIKGRPVYVEQAAKPTPKPEPEMPKSIEEAIAEEALEANK